MQIKLKTMLVSIMFFFFFTVLPFLLMRFLPPELFTYFNTQSGLNLEELLNETAIYGVITTILVFLRGSIDKFSSLGLFLSIASKALWFFGLVFAFSLGDLENLGLATVNSKGSGSINMVIFDFRLFLSLATVIIVLQVIYTIIEFQENRSAMHENVSVVT